MIHAGGQEPSRRGPFLATVVGCLLVLTFCVLAASSNGLRITFHDLQTSSSPGELNFWLGSTALLFPGALLIGYGCAPWIGSAIVAAVARVCALTARERRVAVLALGLLFMAAARIGHAVVLLDLPITDDEYAVEFGGRVLASGHVLAHLNLPLQALPDLFLYFRDGAVGSFDWLGGQIVAAVACTTGLGPFVWAALAALPLVIIAVLMSRRLGAQWGLAVAAIFLASPMALLLSITTHAQLASRAFFAVAVYALWAADSHGGLWRWLGLGASLGAAFLCRPPETAFFSIPILVSIARNIRRPTYRGAITGLVVGGAVFAVIFLWHSYAMTGNALLPARFAVPENTDVMGVSLLSRIANNAGYNVYMLAIWFLGPLGIFLVAAGVQTDRFTRVLSMAIASDLCLTLLHDNPGLHIVGPIHYSELVVPLSIIAAHGLANVLAWSRRHSIDGRLVSAAFTAVLVINLGLFSLVQAVALRRQAEVQARVYATIQHAVHQYGDMKVVILAPWMFSVVNACPALRGVGTWVHDWRRPRLDLQDDVLFLRNTPALEPEVRRALSDRKLYRLQADPQRRLLVLESLDDTRSIPLDGLGPIGP